MESLNLEKISAEGKRFLEEHKKALAVSFGVGVCLKYLTKDKNHENPKT